jgi:hypothetical protein
MLQSVAVFWHMLLHNISLFAVVSLQKYPAAQELYSTMRLFACGLG